MQQSMTVFCPKCGTAMMPVGASDRRRFECARSHQAVEIREPVPVMTRFGDAEADDA